MQLFQRCAFIRIFIRFGKCVMPARNQIDAPKNEAGYFLPLLNVPIDFFFSFLTTHPNTFFVISVWKIQQKSTWNR